MPVEAKRVLFASKASVDENNNLLTQPLYLNERSNAFDRLPDIVIFEIMNYMTLKNIRAMKLTCKRFLELSNNSRFWRAIEVKYRTIKLGNLQAILGHLPRYFQLVHSGVNALPTHEITFPISPRLAYLDLSYSLLKYDLLTPLFKTLLGLKRISLEMLDLEGDVVEAMETFSRTIEVVNLCSCYNIKACDLSSFLNKTLRLRELNIGHIMTVLPERSYHHWTKDEFDMIIRNLPSNLEGLDISGYRILPVNSHMNILVQHCPNLISLDISDSSNSNFDLSYEGNISSLQRLKYLGVSRCNLRVKVLTEHFKLLRNLRYVNFFNPHFRTEKFLELVSEFPKIRFNTSLGSNIARPTTDHSWLVSSAIWGKKLRSVNGQTVEKTA